MTNSIKKLTSLVVALVMTASLAISGFAYDVANDVKGTKYEDAASVLGALKIMIGDDEGNFRPEDGIRRSEFAKVSVYALGLEDSAAEDKNVVRFKDMSANHWANGYVNIAAANQIIIGDDEGNFRPDEQISYQDAITILVRLLGFEPVAETKGGYPNGYLMTANQYGLTKNVSGAPAQATKRGVAAVLTYNALTIGMMEQTSFGNNSNYQQTDTTILEKYLKTVKYSGQITGNYFTKLNASSGLYENEIEIDGTVFKTDDVKATNYLGYKVNYFVQTADNGDERIILARPENGKNRTLVIDGDNVATVEDGKINYWNNKETDNNTKHAKIDAEAKMLYNGVYVDFNNALIKENGDFNGSIELLDVNQNDVYSIVFVNEYKNLVVESTSSLSYSISDKFGGPSLVLDPEDTNVKFTLKDVDGNSFSFADLEEWNVISYLESTDGDIIKATVLDRKVTGKVTEVDDDKYKIDGNFYKVADNYTDAIKLDDEGTFYLDVRGNIAAVDANSTLSDKYAYLVEAAMESGMSDSMQIKVFNMAGEVKILNSNDKVSLNGASKIPARDVLAALKDNGNVVKQLITLETNSDGKITRINTAEVNAGALSIAKDKFTMSYKKDEAVYKSSSKKLDTLNITSQTVVFEIPTTATSEEDYAIRNMNMFENEGKYNVEVYDVSEDLTAKVIVVKNSTGVTNAESPIAVVSKIAQIRNAKDESVQKLYAMVSGEMVELETSADRLLVNESNNQLKPGDIIQYRTNSAGAIDKINVLFEVADKASEFNTVNGDLRLVYGKVTKKFAASMNVSVNGAADENFSFDGAKVVSVDSTKSSNQVTLASAGDIQKYDALSPRLVFVKIYKDVVQEVVIVK